MRNVLLVGAVAFMIAGVANAQTTTNSTTKAQNPGMQSPPTEMHKDEASKQTSQKAGAEPGTNVSGQTSSGTPENPHATKGTEAGTAGSGQPGSGPNASGSGSGSSSQ